MRLLVSDANILIDFEVAGLASQLFELDLELLVPDVLFEDELRHAAVDWLALGLGVRTVTGEGVERAVNLGGKYRRPSRIDLLALVLAEQEKCPLATGDRHLRDAAEAEGVEIRGTLWLADRMVERNVVDPATMRRGYQRMYDGQRRLPWNDVDRRLVGWGIESIERDRQ